MSLELLFDMRIEKPIWDKRAGEFVRKELAAFCNSTECAPRKEYVTKTRTGHYPSRTATHRFTKKDVTPNKIHCPDCGSVLMWKLLK